MSMWLVCLIAFYTVLATEAVNALHHAPEWVGTRFIP